MFGSDQGLIGQYDDSGISHMLERFYCAGDRCTYSFRICFVDNQEAVKGSARLIHCLPVMPDDQRRPFATDLRRESCCTTHQRGTLILSELLRRTKTRCRTRGEHDSENCRIRSLAQCRTPAQWLRLALTMSAVRIGFPPDLRMSIGLDRFLATMNRDEFRATILAAAESSVYW